MFISCVTRRQAHITAVSKIIVNNWKLSGFRLRCQPVGLKAGEQSLQFREDERYQSCFGFWCPYAMDVIHRYLASGS